MPPNSVPENVFETPGSRLVKSAVGARQSEPIPRESRDVETAGRARPEVAGDLEVHELASDVFGNVRKLRVWLPPGYWESANRERSYPVLYLNDGQNLFDAATAVFSSHEWHADETAGELIAQGRMKPIVIVGIDNAGRRGRAKEYLPYPDEFLEPPEPDPLGRLYGRFLAAEVIPFVERRFRVARTPEGRALGGSSYGALIALYVAADRPGLFSRLLLESPSFYVAENRVLRETEPEGLRLQRVYLGVGTNELALEGCPAEHEGNMEAVNGVKRAAELFRRAGLVEGRELKVVVEPCARHGEAAWARRFSTALEFLFASR